VFTEEPTAQQTSLPTEPAGLPEKHSDTSAPLVTNVASFNRWNEWFNLAKAFLLWVASIILLVGVQLIFTLPYFIYLWSTSGPPSVEALANDKIVAFLSIVAVAPSHLLTLGLIWLVVTEGRTKPFWKTVGFDWPENTRPGLVVLTCVGLAVFLLAVGGVATHFWGGNKTQLDLLVESSFASRVATAFVAFFTAPLIEELIYRGVLYSAVEKTLGTVMAFLVVALLFAGVHVFQYKDNIAVIAVITVLSITLTLVRAYSGRVLPSFLIHLVFNGIQSVYIVLSPLVGWDKGTT
jgi:membrane protease YdiL (CAAX protease family)